MKPVWDGKAFQPRLMLPLSLTWDHRVIDGALARASTSTWRSSWATCGEACCDHGRGQEGGPVAIAADTLTTFGDTRLPHSYKAEH
jgi:hypothetical protein